MLFNVALFSGLLLFSVVLAVPSGLGTRIARRGSAISDNDLVYNWAGAFWIEGKETFNFITGSFTVPTPSGATGSSASIWVGIDGLNCTTILQTGIDVTVEDGGPPSYSAWYEWFPDAAKGFSDPIDISAGDNIKLTIFAESPNSGTVTVENLSHDQVVSETISSSVPICGENAEWIVEDYMQGSSFVPFADFGTVTFTNAMAHGVLSYSPYGANIIEIEQNGIVLTNVTINEAGNLTIEYV